MGLILVKEADGAFHEQFIGTAAEGVGHKVVGVAYSRMLYCLQALAEVFGPGYRHRFVGFAVVDADGGVDAI
jgi:hypothetical protein